GPLVCDQSNPISVKAHTLTDVSSIGIALELIHSGGMTIDSIIQITPNATMVSDIAQDGVSPDTLDFGWIRAIPSVPAFSGETIATIWVTPVTGDPFEFREINDLIQKTRYTGPSNLEEFLLPLKTEIMSAGCAGQISLSPDPKLLICPGGDAAFRVQVLDDLGDPVAGNNSVSVELVTCGGLYGCSNGPGIINLLPVAPSDIDGFVTFYAEGGGCDAACMANVKLGGITWARVPVLTFDINSDTLVSVGDFAWDPTCNDYDPTPGITIEDFNAWNPHLGHHCDLDPCERFSAEFTVTPSSNLSPGQVVTLDLELSNNSFDPCFIGLVGFFNSGFGDGEEDILFDNVVFNDTLHPGEAHTISVPFTIPGAGAGCFSTNFLTQAPCCDTAISLRHCAVSTQHCTRDVNLCYEQRISLSKFPVDSFVIIDDFLPNPTWQIVPLNLPATPLNSADTIVYEVCTPPLASLGDSAVAVVYVYSEGRLIPEVFETEVFVTSRTGDANGDCRVNIADITYMIARLFAAGPDAIPPEAGDPNCSGSLNVADITYLIALIFAGGPAPCVK
ncbi:MAG: dockerin type I repeat-containing protein, partial [Candidatus Zixiibacteriota bacterium]